MAKYLKLLLFSILLIGMTTRAYAGGEFYLQTTSAHDFSGGCTNTGLVDGNGTANVPRCGGSSAGAFYLDAYVPASQTAGAGTLTFAYDPTVINRNASPSNLGCLIFSALAETDNAIMTNFFTGFSSLLTTYVGIDFTGAAQNQSFSSVVSSPGNVINVTGLGNCTGTACGHRRVVIQVYYDGSGGLCGITNSTDNEDIQGIRVLYN